LNIETDLRIAGSRSRRFEVFERCRRRMWIVQVVDVENATQDDGLDSWRHGELARRRCQRVYRRIGDADTEMRVT